MDLPVGSYVIKKSSTKKMGFANGGVVPAILTPGELVIDPKEFHLIENCNVIFFFKGTNRICE
jgi:hypothetical protein